MIPLSKEQKEEEEKSLIFQDCLTLVSPLSKRTKEKIKLPLFAETLRPRLPTKTIPITKCEVKRKIEGKAFRDSLRDRTPSKLPRQVPPFSLQSLQKNVVVAPPDPNQRYISYPIGNTRFKRSYLLGELPISLLFAKSGIRLSWKTPIPAIDYPYFLPLFFEGLCETEDPYAFFASQGLHDLLLEGRTKVLPLLPRIIIPIKNAMNTRSDIVVLNTMKVIQHLAMLDFIVGKALVPYYNMFIPNFNIYKNKNRNIGDRIEYDQYKRRNIGDVANETLRILEKYGGPDAYINLKYIIPTYESGLYNY